MITKATYAGSSNTMCTIEPSMEIVPSNDQWVTEWVDAGNTIFPYVPLPQTADEARNEKHTELRQNAIDASLEPVVAIGFMWNGGEESRDRMLAKANHMESQGIATSQSWDINNIMHAVSDIDVRLISNAITENVELVGHHYREKKNEYLACGDDVACINAVVW